MRGVNLTGHDVYVNVAGGLRIEEPAADLAVAGAGLEPARAAGAQRHGARRRARKAAACRVPSGAWPRRAAGVRSAHHRPFADARPAGQTPGNRPWTCAQRCFPRSPRAGTRPTPAAAAGAGANAAARARATIGFHRLHQFHPRFRQFIFSLIGSSHKIIQLLGALIGAPDRPGPADPLGHRRHAQPNRPAFLMAMVAASLLFGYLAIPYITVYPTRWAVDRLAGERRRVRAGGDRHRDRPADGLLVGVPLSAWAAYRAAAHGGRHHPGLVMLWATLYKRDVLVPALSGVLPGAPRDPARRRW